MAESLRFLYGSADEQQDEVKVILDQSFGKINVIDKTNTIGI